MAHQAPMISIPKKGTDEVDWTSPIRSVIAQSYGESPDTYAAECAALQRCRQDAVKGAGSDLTARDLLYRYFGQLELVELRFPEIRVNFPWRDAFTNKQITQTSIAYEKASVIFLIAATHSSIAASQNRSDPEGLKRAYHYFRTCAGMLTYINENFLHAPSTDLSREVIKFLIGVILAQGNEVFLEKCISEKKPQLLISKLASHVAYSYTSLSEEVKEFMGRGILDRNWVTVIQAKAKYFTSVTQYQRGLVDDAAGKHGEALARFTLAETNAKEANRAALSFASLFVNQLSPNLPPDAGPTLQELTKAHLAICTAQKNDAQKANDLIYNAVLPGPEALPAVDKTSATTPITIQEVYSNPDVQKVIGQDIFIKLVPLSVHESASVYSEEKAKLARSEVEKVEVAEGEVKSVLDSLGVREGLSRYKSMVEGSIGREEEVPLEVRRWRDDIRVIEGREPVESLLSQLASLKANVKAELEGASRDLEIESKDCETMRIKYDTWSQEPSSSLTKNIRQDLKSHISALDAASASDRQVAQLWGAVNADIRLLLSDELDVVFRESVERSSSQGESLLDLDVSSEVKDEEEKRRIEQLVNEIEVRLNALHKIGKEREQVLKDLKEKIQTDDVSHLLLLNRRNTGVETTLFANELEKFRPYQQRLVSTIHHQQLALQELTSLWRRLRDHASRGPGVKKWEEREKRKKDAIKRFSRARDGYMEVRDGIAKGLHFYNDLTELCSSLSKNVKSFVSGRRVERETLASQLETQKRLIVTSPPQPSAERPRPPVPPPPPSSHPSQTGLEPSFGSMSIRPPPPLPAPSQTQFVRPSPGETPGRYGPVPSPSLQQKQQPQPYIQPPPPPQNPIHDPYAGLGMLGNSTKSPFSTPTPPPPPQNTYSRPQQTAFSPPPPPQHDPYQPQGQQQLPNQFQQTSGFPPPPTRQPSYPSPLQTPPRQHGHQQQPSQGWNGGGLPPPPPPVTYQSQQYGVSPPQQQQQQPQQGGYPSFPPPPPQSGYGGYGQYGR